MPVRIKAGISRGRMNQMSESPVLAPIQGRPGSFQYATTASTRASEVRRRVGRSKGAARGMRALYTGWERCEQREPQDGPGRGQAASEGSSSERPHLMTVRWTIRTKLAALVLAVLLPLVAGAAFKFWRDLAQGRADAQGRLLATAEIVARHLDEVLSGQIEDLEALASVRSLDRIHGEDLRTLAARVRVRHPFVHRFLAAGPDGRITASSLSPVAGSGASAVDTG